MKMVRTDKQGRKAGKLGYICICPHCGETLTRRKHQDEAVFAILIVFLPAIIVWCGFALDSLGTIIIAVVTCVTVSIYSFFHYKYKLKNWSRWIEINEYLSNKYEK